MLLIIKVLIILSTLFNFSNTRKLDENVVSTVDLGITSKAGILIDAESGKVLYSKNEHEKLYPASMTKMVGLVIILDYLEAGKIQLTDMVTTSAEAASMGGTQIFLQPGEQMSVNDLLKSVAINSANDAIYALAEAVCGSEQAFVKKMNELAKSLGMNDSNFINTNGFDDPNHYTSAYDMALIARKLVSYGDAILQYTSKYDDYIRTDTANPFWLVNTNKLIRTYNGMDGLKTGFTQDAGFCLAATAKRDNLRLIAVSMKAETKEIRSKDISIMLNYGFANYEAHKVYSQGEIIDYYEFNNSADGKTPIAVNKDVYIIVVKGSETTNLSVSYVIDEGTKAPITINNRVGIVTISNDDGTIVTCELISTVEVTQLTWWKIVVRTFQQLLLN